MLEPTTPRGAVGQNRYIKTDEGCSVDLRLLIIMSSPASSIVTNRKRDSSSSRAKNCAECRRLKIKCDRQVGANNAKNTFFGLTNTLFRFHVPTV